MALALSGDEVHQIAVGCFYIFMRKGQLNFPDSTVAHPSPLVVVNRAGAVIRSGDEVYFPFSVPWDVWQYSVVPILKDRAYQVFHSDGTRNQVNLAMIRLGEYTRYINLLTDALINKMQEVGFLPQTPVTTPAAEGDLPGDGEPIMRVGSIGDPGFPLVDVGADGLTYPIVED